MSNFRVSTGVIGHFLLGRRPVEHLPPGQRRMVQPETRAHQRSA
jgi:hypothetical protein